MKDTEKKPKRFHSDIVRDSINTFGTNAIGSLLSIISAFFVLGVLDPDVKGQYNQVQLVGNGLFTLFGFSINAAMIYFVSRFKIKNTKKAITTLTTAMSILIMAAGAAAVLFMKQIFFPGSTAFYCWAAVVYGLFSFLLNVCLAILRGENKFKMFNTINLLQKVLLTAFMFSMLLWPSAMLLVTSMIGIQVLMIVLAMYGIKRWNGKEPEPAPDDDFPVRTGAMLRYSLKSHVSNVMTYINSYLGSYIVNAVYSLSTFGIYNAAVTMMQQVWLLPDAVSQVIMSRIAAMHEKDDKVRLTLMSCKVVTYITIVCAVLLVLVAQVFVPIVFPKYVEAIAPLRYLIIGSVFICYAKVLANSIAAYGKPELNILPPIIGIIVHLSLSFVLIPLMGVNGIALATSASLTAQGFTSMVIFCLFTHTPFYRLLIPNGEEIRSVKQLFRK